MAAFRLLKLATALVAAVAPAVVAANLIVMVKTVLPAETSTLHDIAAVYWAVALLHTLIFSAFV